MTTANAPSPRGLPPSARPRVPRLPGAPGQLKAKGAASSAVAAAPGLTGLPESLKVGVEALSGLAMNDVRVHRNSAEPAKVGALAFARGGDIHLGAGQEHHLPHEAWHVVQQKQGRVLATTRLKGAGVNDSPALEAEAHAMGSRATAAGAGGTTSEPQQRSVAQPVVQRVIIGLERYQDMAEIPADWVEQYREDLKEPQTHLYQEDIEIYLDAHVQGWSQHAILVNHLNHWDVRFGDRIVTVSPDGDCGAHVIDAVTKGRDGVAAAVHRADPEAIRQYREAISLASRNYPDDSIRLRIADEIKAGVAVAETGFGPRLSAILLPLQQAAAKGAEEEEQKSSGGSSGAKAEDTAGKYQDAPFGPPGMKTRIEDATHVGFEIELGAKYSVARFAGAASFVNETLLVYHDEKDRPLLEMLLDDVKPLGGGRLSFQIEFRTVKLELDSIGSTLADKVRKAINSLNAKKALAKDGPGARGWKRTERGDAFMAKAGDSLQTQTVRFHAPPNLAQHVTSSINLEAYSKLPPKQQRLLYPQGEGSGSRAALYGKIADTMSVDDLDVSTTGRNDARVMVKSPLEAMIAAEYAHGIRGAEAALKEVEARKQPSKVSVSDNEKDQHGVAPLAVAISSIFTTGAYPAMQGRRGHGPLAEIPTGYRAIGEKLQPPLYDTSNDQLRVLVEHRTGELRAAFNAALTSGGDIRAWEAFKKAAKAMDELAKSKSTGPRHL